MITQTKHPDLPTVRRSWLRRVGLLLAFCFVGLFLLRDRPEVRFLIARGADFALSHVDPFSNTQPINFGPAPSASTEESTSLIRQIEQAFPRYQIEIDDQQPEFLDSIPLQFGHESLAHERVGLFASNLPFEVHQADTVLDLSEKVRGLAHHGDDVLPPTDTDPIEYLNYATQGHKLTCRYFAILFGATAQSAGYTTRLFTLSKSGGTRDHAVSEVYVPEFGKWVMIDPDFNVAYRRDGIWLDTRELHNAWLSLKEELNSSGIALEDFNQRSDRAEEVKRRTGVELVELGPAGESLRHTNMYTPSVTGINLEFFEYVVYRIRNDYLSATYPIGHPIRTREYVLQQNPHDGPPPICPAAYVIQEIQDFYWPVGRSWINIQNWKTGENPLLDLKLSTWTPNFEGFEIRVDRRDWTQVDEHRMSLELHTGTNVIEARSINLAGLRGETARITIQLNQREGDSKTP